MTENFRGLAQGAVVVLNLSARVFGLRLLRLEGQVVLTPIEPLAPRQPQLPRPRPASDGVPPSAHPALRPSADQAPTASLSEARRLVRESERSLVSTRHADPGVPLA